MFRALPLLALVTLTACVGTQSSDRDRCISRASGNLTTLNRLISETQANIDRGYAVQIVREDRTIDRFCTGRNDDGTRFRFPCQDTVPSTRRVPVAIDLNDEQAKLNSMLDRQAQLQRATQAAIAQCQASYPVTPVQ